MQSKVFCFIDVRGSVLFAQRSLLLSKRGRDFFVLFLKGGITLQHGANAFFIIRVLFRLFIILASLTLLKTIATTMFGKLSSSFESAMTRLDSLDVLNEYGLSSESFTDTYTSVLNGFSMLTTQAADKEDDAGAVLPVVQKSTPNTAKEKDEISESVDRFYDGLADMLGKIFETVCDETSTEKPLKELDWGNNPIIRGVK